jgi:hypothetical protein
MTCSIYKSEDLTVEDSSTTTPEFERTEVATAHVQQQQERDWTRSATDLGKGFGVSASTTDMYGTSNEVTGEIASASRSVDECRLTG